MDCLGGLKSRNRVRGCKKCWGKVFGGICWGSLMEKGVVEVWKGLGLGEIRVSMRIWVKLVENGLFGWFEE